MRFYVGLHQPGDAQHFDYCLISVNRLMRKQKDGCWKMRKSDIKVKNWIMDSGAFTAVANHGDHILSVEQYAQHIRRWKQCGNLVAAVTQDYPVATVDSVVESQLRTYERYKELVAQNTGVYIMPVLQGRSPSEFVEHLQLYGDMIPLGGWVGVGSLVAISSIPDKVEAIVQAIVHCRPDVQLHGFGLKKNAFTSPYVVDHLATSDSIAWSKAAREEGRNQNCWREAKRYIEELTTMYPKILS